MDLQIHLLLLAILMDYVSTQVDIVRGSIFDASLMFGGGSPGGSQGSPNTRTVVVTTRNPRQNRFRNRPCTKRRRRNGKCQDENTTTQRSPRSTRTRITTPRAARTTTPRATGAPRATRAPRTPAPASSINSVPTVQLSDIRSVRAGIRDFVNQDHEMIPNLVQLVFHTCIGGCDGCINFKEPGNKGLIGTYGVIRQFWNGTAKNVLSLADMIVLMSIEATDIGMQQEGGPGSFDVNFETGRQTCDDPDNYDKAFIFPHGGSRGDLETLRQEFGLTRAQTVALMGAHTVGRCHNENSGFAGRWDNTELIFDNHYYKSLTGTDWKSVNFKGQFQWNATQGDNSRMMLTSDLSMLKDFTLDTRGKPSCTPAKTCDDSQDARQVKRYSKDDQLWKTDYEEAFQIMVRKGL